jgi:threonine-phosphate decarboxylase
MEGAQMTVHGGDVWQVASDLGIHAEELLDFSANVNPRGLPPCALARLAHDVTNPQLLRKYPDPSARTLRTALSRQLDVPPESIVIGPGAEALIGPALRTIGARRALVPIPAFSEYARVCAQQEIEFVPFPLERAECFRISRSSRSSRSCIDRLCESAAHCDVLFLNNPHNPSGALLESEDVFRVLNAPTAVLLDEAFIDYALHASVTAEAASRRGLIVLRSLTKFYGCPALRVGYAVARPDTAREIASLLPTWPVTQIALDALAVAVGDREYAEASLRENAERRETLRQSLEALGLTVFPSAANYLLVELQPHMKRAAELRACLIERHRILIRNCDSYEGLETGRYMRVAVLTDAENIRLIEALAVELIPS